MEMKKSTLVIFLLLWSIMILPSEVLSDGVQPEIDSMPPFTCKEQCYGHWSACVAEEGLWSQGCADWAANCWRYCDAGGVGPGMPSRGEIDCPPGTTTNVLGACVVDFKNVKVKEPECEPSETDDCRPRITLSMLPKADGVFVMCPGGMMPMPGEEACRPLVSNDDDASEPGQVKCPPGWSQGEDDGRCKPPIRPGVTGDFDRMLAEISSQSEVHQEQMMALHELGEAAGILLETANPEEMINRVAEELGEDWQRD